MFSWRNEMTKRVAWFTGKASSGAVTPHKVYDVFNEDGDSFNLKDDTGDTRFCLKQGCAHICYKDWVFADVVEVGMKADTIVKPKKSKKWSEWRKHTTGNVPKELEGDDIVKVKLRNLPKGNPFTVGTGCWVECGDYTIMEYKVKLKDVPTNDSKYSSKVQEKPKSKWTKNTGVLPVDSDIEVEFKRRDGDKDKDEAGECDWRVQGQDYDIIKWRLVD
jgi:hypothetical protein